MSEWRLRSAHHSSTHTHTHAKRRPNSGHSSLSSAGSARANFNGAGHSDELENERANERTNRIEARQCRENQQTGNSSTSFTVEWRLVDFALVRRRNLVLVGSCCAAQVGQCEWVATREWSANGVKSPDLASRNSRAATVDNATCVFALRALHWQPTFSLKSCIAKAAHKQQANHFLSLQFEQVDC